MAGSPPTAVLLLALACARVDAGLFPRRRVDKLQRDLNDLEQRSRERLSTYETALQIQHRKLMELRHRNVELERVCGRLLNIIVFYIAWPRVSRFVAGVVANRRRIKGKRTTFGDVAGCEEAKKELQEVVEFLKHPKKFKEAGARVPKGIMMEGAPGVGKTMLARAVAGEAGVSFIDTTGSSLGSTIYVGVGASKVRALFAEARRKRPCIVFIDEIDALGARREASPSGGSQEAARTLNQLLTEMDGFTSDAGVVVMAATNRADVLDPALLRAGRFDRRVPIQMPNLSERENILKVHAKGKRLASSVNLGTLARQTTGFSGAELATLVNEAAIGAACGNRTLISQADVDAALEKMQIGLRRPSHANNRTRAYVAFHEAGHACASLLTGYDNVSKVTILPRSNGVGGFTSFANTAADEHGGLPTRERLLQELVVLLGGRVAEELRFGRSKVTVGASDDLQRVRKLAFEMVNKYGMAEDEFGLLLGAGRDMDYWNPVPDDVGRRAARYAERIVQRAYVRCRRLLRTNWRLVNAMADSLLEQETIGQEQVQMLLDNHRRSWWFWPQGGRTSVTIVPGMPAPALPAAPGAAAGLPRVGRLPPTGAAPPGAEPMVDVRPAPGPSMRLLGRARRFLARLLPWIDGAQ